MTARLGCMWEEQHYSGFGRSSIVKTSVRTAYCSECPYKCGSRDCQTVMNVYHAEPLTKERQEEVMMNGYFRRPEPPKDQPGVMHQTRFRYDDGDGGEPQISFHADSEARECAELGMRSLRMEQTEGATA